MFLHGKPSVNNRKIATNYSPNYTLLFHKPIVWRKYAILRGFTQHPYY